jgi:hypothetical protein
MQSNVFGWLRIFLKKEGNLSLTPESWALPSFFFFCNSCAQTQLRHSNQLNTWSLSPYLSLSHTHISRLGMAKISIPADICG